MTISKFTNFTTLATYSAIELFLKKSPIHAEVLDTAFESSDSVYLARVISDEYSDSTSEDAMQVTTFKNRSAEMAVYISPRRNSIFNAQLDDVVALFKVGYKVYVIDEYVHSGVSIRLASSGPIRSAKAILTGSFQDGVKLTCRWDSSFAFFAQPRSWSKPSPEFLEEFSNWMNGYSYSYEILKATISGTNDEGESIFEIKTIDQCCGYYSSESAEASALYSLESICKHADAVTA